MYSLMVCIGICVAILLVIILIHIQKTTEHSEKFLGIKHKIQFDDIKVDETTQVPSENENTIKQESAISEEIAVEPKKKKRRTKKSNTKT